jgi:NADPH2:quinone reductase
MLAPTPKAGEVLVRVHASSVNPVDTKRRRGFGSVYGAPMPFPRVVPHDDGAGVITDVGKGVARSRIGQRVWIYLAQARRPYGPPALRDGRPFGAAAEYVAIPETLALPLPDHVSFAEGSVIGIPAITAHRCIFADGDVNGRTILVAGGAGSVGQYAVQFAKLAGARVISTVSGPQKADIVRRLGSDIVGNYRDSDASDQILKATSGRGVDLICETDFAANLGLDASVLAPQGRINTFGSDSNHRQ